MLKFGTRFAGPLVLALTLVCTSCFPLSLGRRFASDPQKVVKVGFHQEQDVVDLLGRPYRRTIDADGRVLLVYLWTDGEGAGEKCVIGFNELGVAHSLEVSP